MNCCCSLTGRIITWIELKLFVMNGWNDYLQWTLRSLHLLRFILKRRRTDRNSEPLDHLTSELWIVVEHGTGPRENRNRWAEFEIGQHCVTWPKRKTVVSIFPPFLCVFVCFSSNYQLICVCVCVCVCVSCGDGTGIAGWTDEVGMCPAGWSSWG